MSPQVTQLLGVSQEAWLSDPYCWRRHVHNEDIDRVWDEYLEAYNEHTTLNHEYRMVHEDGTVRWVLEQAYPIRDEDGNPWLIQGIIFDITERKNAEDQIAYLAYHDKLTGLPNRAFFEEMLETAIARARRHDLAVGVLFLDLDNFKLVNDSLGHHAGDMLLAQLAERLKGCTRETDLVARQGGDEFLLLLSDIERGANPSLPGTDWRCWSRSPWPRAMHDAMQEPFHLNGTEFIASGSIGISLFPQDALDADTLLKNADTAMYQSKKHEPGGYVIFATGGEDPMEKLSFTTRLRRASEHQNWVLHYQPILDLSDCHDDRRRGPDPLAGAQRRHRPPGRVHPARRGARPDRGDRRLGDRRDGRPAARLGRRGSRPRGLVQPLAAPTLVGAPRGQDPGQAQRRRGSTRAGWSWRSRSRPPWPTPTARRRS